MSGTPNAGESIEAFLARHERKELLRFVAVGSVDDGKSTLIGRLLHDTQGLYEDQLAAVRRASKHLDDNKIDFSFFTDGLKAEREQGITIDVAYRYFSTDRRKFIIADTPGHVQYTRNMATGASTADAAIILVDARLGVLQQSKRHAFIASLLGIPHLFICINKMDLVGYDRAVFERIRDHFIEFASKLRFKSVLFIPVSALEGDNVVTRSTNMSWHTGPTVLELLETIPLDAGRNLEDFRLPVQLVIRPNLDFRGFAGQIASGIVRTGDRVMALPSGRVSTVRSIETYDGTLDEAFAPMSVTLRLADEIDVSRGEMITHVEDLPRASRAFDAHLVWMTERELDLQKTYFIKHTTQMIRVQVDQIHHKIDPDTLAEAPAVGLGLNDIGKVRLTCHRALYYDAYERNRATGAFILIDSLTNDTVAAGMILDDRRTQNIDEALREVRAGSGIRPKTQVSPRERRERMGQDGVTVWLTGLPGSGRWTLSYVLERKLFDLGRTAHVLEPKAEDLRSMISAAKACTDAGLVTICAFQTYSERERDEARARIGAERFIEVFVDTSPELCRERRPDANFEGFEPPTRPNVTVTLDIMRVEKAVDRVLDALENRGQFDEELGIPHKLDAATDFDDGDPY